MIGKIYTPNPTLRQFINSYIVFDFINNIPEIQCTIPKGACALVISYKGNKPNIICENNDKQFTANSFIIGYLLKAAKLKTLGHINAIVVLFTPLGAYYLLKIPPKEYVNQFVLFENIIGRNANIIEEQVKTAKNTEQAIQIIESYFLNIFKSKINLHICDYAISLIQNHLGNLRVDQLFFPLNITHKTLYRKFNELLGISPKEYIWLTRLNAVYKMLLRDVYNVHEIINLLGYFDQSHLIKDLKKYSDITPMFFRNIELTAITANLYCDN